MILDPETWRSSFKDERQTRRGQSRGKFARTSWHTATKGVFLPMKIVDFIPVLRGQMRNYPTTRVIYDEDRLITLPFNSARWLTDYNQCHRTGCPIFFSAEIANGEIIIENTVQW